MNKKKSLTLCLDLLLIIILIAFDQFTKYLSVTRLKGKPAYSIIDGVLELQYLENRGSAFGILQGQKWFLLIVSCIFIALLTLLLVRIPQQRKYMVLHIAISGIIAGGLGNMIDRFRLGYVVDFISFVLIHYPIFNVADSYVVISSILLFILILFVYKEDDFEKIIGRKKKQD